LFIEAEGKDNMFTGIVEGIGQVVFLQETESGRVFEIEFEWEENDIKIGHSIAINGACQTITEINEKRNRFKIYSSYKTLELTNLGMLLLGDWVNLERSVTPLTRLGGHFVQGHVDGTGAILSWDTKDNGKVSMFRIQYPKWMDTYIVKRGSIAVDGISLTVVDLPEESTMELVLIPETIQKTNAQFWKPGRHVNLEIDLIARYLEKWLSLRS